MKPEHDDPAALVRTVSEALVASYRSDARGHRIHRAFLPSRAVIVECIDLCLQVLYPGYYGEREELTFETVGARTEAVVGALFEKLSGQVSLCLCFAKELSGQCCKETEPERMRAQAEELTASFLYQLPEIRGTLLSDIQAAYDGDPAATNVDEVVLAYPGVLAVTVYRIAHALHGLGVPLMPRIMTEWAHTKTGADIHPGAEIGSSFFVDHATGVVIGETSRIGAGVKLYQGVTLGALSHPKTADGRIVRGEKRHPTVERGVTIYANSTVLGGRTIVGSGSTIGGSVFLTKSVPDGSRVAVKPPELVLKAQPDRESGEPLDELPLFPS